jgi:hypothetical protein
MRLGVIAEDKSDVEVVEVLARKIARTPFTLRFALGHGCRRLHSKALTYAKHLRGQQCSLLMLVCDLDDNRLADLSRRLHAALQPCPIERHVVVIPVREIEVAVGRPRRRERGISPAAPPEAAGESAGNPSSQGAIARSHRAAFGRMCHVREHRSQSPDRRARPPRPAAPVRVVRGVRSVCADAFGVRRGDPVRSASGATRPNPESRRVDCRHMAVCRPSELTKLSQFPLRVLRWIRRCKQIIHDREFRRTGCLRNQKDTT